MKVTKQYPNTYLHVQECRSGQEWIVPIGDDESIDLREQIAKWAAQEFGGELKLDGQIMPNLEGDYYGRIITDGRSPESIVCWEGGGFYLTNVQ